MIKKILSKFGYFEEFKTGVWGRHDFEGIGYSDGDEVELRIANVIEQAKDISVLSSELRSHCTDWPSLYHLSGLRANLLRPLNGILRDADVLEIGAGCGAITRHMGEQGARVLALEGSPRRAAIARSRTRDLENVTVVTDSFAEFETDQQFDVITLIGVLEYAGVFSNASDPALTLLQRVRTLLKPSGKLVIAIENQLGLKYFAGYSEDHLGQPMYGIEGRYRKGQPQTWGRVALQRLLGMAGFPNAEFMAPFPDYKLPVSIVSEIGFTESGFDAGAFAWQNVTRDAQFPGLLAFSPELVWPVLTENGMALDMANSFLVIAGSETGLGASRDVLAWHYSTERAKAFCKETRFLMTEAGDIEVQYQRLSDSSKHQLAGEAEIQFSFPPSAPYVKGRPLSQDLIRVVTRDGWRIEDVGLILQRYLSIVRMVAAERGYNIHIKTLNDSVPGELVDCIPQNIFIKTDRSWALIDQEWKLAHDITVGQLLFRTLFSLIHSLTRFGKSSNCKSTTPIAFIQAAFQASVSPVNEDIIHGYARREVQFQMGVAGRSLDSEELIRWLCSTSLPTRNLSTALEERKGEFANLSTALETRNGEFANLSTALETRNGEFATTKLALGKANDQIHMLSLALLNREAKIASLEDERRETLLQIKELDNAILEDERRETLLQIKELDNAIHRARMFEGMLNDVYSSRSWTITAPLRGVKRLALIVSQRLSSQIGFLLKSVLHRLPLSPVNKAMIRDGFYRHVAFAVKETNSYRRWVAFKVAEAQLQIGQSEGYSFDAPGNQEKVDEVIAFKWADEPEVSIVIPVYNNWIFTANCLRSVLKNSEGSVQYEVIIADDCSNDDTNLLASDIQGLRVITNERNLGFLRNCNSAVKHARGKYVVLLNNDTEVGPGWLQSMLNVFQNFNRVGVVAAKLLYPDGRIQEAGGIMMRNGWGHPFGRFGDPQEYQFNYVKEVDCAIGACLMIDRELFEKIGGFDDRYAPAHYEEFDLEFAVRAAGYKVMYQPAAEIVHHESISGGSEFRDRQSVINHEKFCLKWDQVLQSRPTSEAEFYPARDCSGKRKRILLVEDTVPQHDKHAGAVTIFQYVNLLTDLGFKVVYFPDNLYPHQPYTADLQQMGVEVIYGNFNFKAWFEVNGSFFNYCWLCRPDVAKKYLETVRTYSNARVLYYTHDLHYLREHRYFELEGGDWHRKESLRLKAIETSIFATVDVVLTPSEDEAAVIREEVSSASIVTMPAYMYDSGASFGVADKYQGFMPRKNLLFLGGFGHAPNVDAVLWFVKEVLPFVRKRLPEVEFHIAGSNVPDEVLQLEQPGVNVRGYVSDLDQLFFDFRVFVAPLRYGAGVKGKIVTSLHQGVPVVTTSIGNEGLNLVDEEQALVADTPAIMAEKICRLYEDGELWRKISIGGSEFIRENFSIETARNAVLKGLGVAAERCFVCGDKVFFSPKPDVSNLREEPVCPQCWTLKRMNDLAHMLVSVYGGGVGDSMCSIFDRFSHLAIYEIGYVGPIHDLLSKIPGFVCSEYFEDVPLGQVGPKGVRCENIERLTFESESFDLVISQDVFEHVADPLKGFQEIYRVLRQGGVHVFTIPFSKSRESSFVRAKIVDGELSLLADPVYHGDPVREEGALVFTDFGSDLIDGLRRIGFEVQVFEINLPQFQGGGNTVFVTKRAVASSPMEFDYESS